MPQTWVAAQEGDGGEADEEGRRETKWFFSYRAEDDASAHISVDGDGLNGDLSVEVVSGRPDEEDDAGGGNGKEERQPWRGNEEVGRRIFGVMKKRRRKGSNENGVSVTILVTRLQHLLLVIGFVRFLVYFNSFVILAE